MPKQAIKSGLGLALISKVGAGTRRIQRKIISLAELGAPPAAVLVREQTAHAQAVSVFPSSRPPLTLLRDISLRESHLFMEHSSGDGLLVQAKERHILRLRAVHTQAQYLSEVLSRVYFYNSPGVLKRYPCCWCCYLG